MMLSLVAKTFKPIKLQSKAPRLSARVESLVCRCFGSFAGETKVAFVKLTSPAKCFVTQMHKAPVLMRQICLHYSKIFANWLYFLHSLQLSIVL